MSERLNVPATWLLIIVNALVFLLDWITGGSILLWGSKSPEIWHGQIYRLLTANFLHAGLLHIGFNLYALLIFGRIVEGIAGSVRFSLVFFISGITGYALSLLATPALPAVGASAAIFGLMGYTLHYRLRRLPRRWLSIDSAFLQIFVLNLGLGLFVPRIDNFAHLGGILGGILSGSIVGLPSTIYQPIGVRAQGRRWLETVAGLTVFALVLSAALAPMSFAAILEPIQPKITQRLHARYLPFFLPVRVEGFQVYSVVEQDNPQWTPIKEVLQPPAGSAGALGVFWNWRSLGSNVQDPMHVSVEWARRAGAGDPWSTVRTHDLTVSKGDADPNLVYLKDVVEVRRWNTVGGNWRVSVLLQESGGEDVALAQRDFEIRVE